MGRGWLGDRNHCPQVARRCCREGAAAKAWVGGGISMSCLSWYRRSAGSFVALFTAILLASVALAGDDGAKQPPAGLRVFYTGHSFHMFVPPRVEQLVKSAGIQGHKLVGTQGIGGSRVIQHWDLADDKNKAKAALATGEVDVF